MFSADTTSNLLEVRKRLIYCLCFYAVIFTICFYCSNIIFGVLAEPLLKFLPTNSSLIATEILSPVVMPIKLAMNIALFLSIPFVFYQTWLFIAPGLYPNEKKYIIPLVLCSIILFLVGVLFAYQFVLPMMFSVFVAWLPTNVAIMTDINNYLDFFFNMLLIFGLVFQIPLVLIVLTKLNVITAKQLVNFRSYFVIIAFIISMFLTPPDVISMIMLALPICLLYEAGIVIAKVITKPQSKLLDSK